MSKGYIVYRNAELWGVLEDKEEYKTFKEQRCGGDDVYDFVKLEWKEIMRILEEQNIGCYSTLKIHNMEDVIIFAHEYDGLIEHCYMELDGSLDLMQVLFSDVKEYFKLDSEEEILINGFIVMYSKMFTEAYDNGVWFEKPVRGLDLRPYVEGWVESMRWND